MKVKDLIKELINFNMEDYITVKIMWLPDGKTYTAKLDDKLPFLDNDPHPSFLLQPTDFHSKEDENYNPVPTTLKNTLCAVMAAPTDDGSYKEICDEFEEGEKG